MEHVFTKAFKYHSEFKSVAGDNVRIESVCIMIPGVQPATLLNEWNRQQRIKYTFDEMITVQEALDTPTLPDRLSLQAYIDLIGQESKYITHHYSLVHL
jgi:hypothetical protein